MNVRASTVGSRSAGKGGKGHGRKPAYKPKIHMSLMTKIARETFNTGYSKFASQFKTSRRDNMTIYNKHWSRGMMC